MRYPLHVVFLSAIVLVFITPVILAQPAAAKAILAQYQSLPFPEEDAHGEARTPRLAALRKLQALADTDVVPAVREMFEAEANPSRRDELLEALRNFPGNPAADLLVHALADPVPAVRRQAMHTLRLFARRVDRSGPERTQRGETTAPKVPGLVPHLIEAADDADPLNRDAALFALADTLDPAAIERIRAALKDPVESVRLHAACFLTEFHDASGLDELKAAVIRLRNSKDELRWFDVGRVAASMERITGKSFGPLPMNPMLSSSSDRAAAAEREYARILDAWVAWWAWEPEK